MIEKYALFKVLHKILEEPKEYSLRELAKKSGVAVGSAKYCADYLYSKEIVKLRKIGRTYQYSLNLENILTRQIKILRTLDELLESGFVKELIEKYSKITSIVLYGSAARGEDDPKSDIDILIISREKVKIAGLKSEKNVRRELNLSAYTLNDWKERAKKDKVFYDRVIIDGIALYGEIPKVD